VQAAPPPPAASSGEPGGTAPTTPDTPVATPEPPKPSAEVVVLIVPRGTRLAVRMSRSIDVKHASSGEHFSGTVAEPVVVGNTVAIPEGSVAEGEILIAHRRGRFKGRSVLTLKLTRLNVNGTDYRIETSDLTRSKRGKGKRSLALIGGGAGLGMLVGGVATGGVGLLVGGLAGGGAGTLASAFTGNRDITIPAESIVSFRLENSLRLTPADTPAEAR
jgi:hypothetical protein